MTTPAPSDFAALLRQLRVQRGLSQQKLADLANLSVGVVSSAEAGRSLPSVKNGVALHRALDNVQPVEDAATAAWATALDTAESLLRRHYQQFVQGYLATSPSTPADHAAAAHAALGRLLTHANPAAVLGLLTAAEHLLAGQAQPPAAATAASLAVWPGSVRTSSTGPDGQPVTVYHPTTQPTPAADPQRRAKPQAGQQ